MIVDDTARRLRDWIANSGRDRAADLMGRWLEGTPHPFARKQTDPGHITASAVAIHAAQPGLVAVRHPAILGWVQPGGHAESSDATLVQTATRELFEETKVRGTVLRNGAFLQLDVYPVPQVGAERAHLHVDAKFALVLNDDEVSMARDGDCWLGDADVRVQADATVQSAYARARCWLKTSPINASIGS